MSETTKNEKNKKMSLDSVSSDVTVSSHREITMNGDSSPDREMTMNVNDAISWFNSLNKQ